MDLTYLKNNAGVAKKYCAGITNSFKYMLLVYSSSSKQLRKLTGERSFRLNFIFPEPVGRIKLKLRNNRGSDSFIFSELFLHKYYDFKMISKPDTILDLGANIGLTALFWSRVYPDSALACVEPMPNNLEVLKWNLRQNDVKATLIEGAVAVEDGEIFMEVAEKDYGHQIATNPVGNQNVIKVKAFSMNSILEKLEWPHIGLLKIDIEGYETYLLKNNCDWLFKVDYIIIEIHDASMKAELEQMAEKYGFARPMDVNGLWHLARIK